MKHSSTVKSKISDLSEHSDENQYSDHYQYERSKTENVNHELQQILNRGNIFINLFFILFLDKVDITIENSKSHIKQKESNKSSLTPSIQLNDEDIPIGHKIKSLNIKLSKNFERSSLTKPEIRKKAFDSSSGSNSNSKSNSGSESSLDDYTIANKNIKSLHMNDSKGSLKKKINTMTDLALKVNNNYRNSKIISFGRKFNTQTQHNYTEYNKDKSIIQEEGEEMKNEKNEEEVEAYIKNTNSLIDSPQKMFLEPNSPKRSPKKSKQEEVCQINSINEPKSPKVHQKITSKLYQLISQFYIVKRFMTSLINATIYRKPKHLKKMHYNLINDWSVYNQREEEEEIKKTYWTVFKEVCIKKIKMISKNNKRLSKSLRYFWKGVNSVFHPTHPFKILWDIIHFLLILLYLIIIPLNISFNVNLLEYYANENTYAFYFIKSFSFFFFIIDILINFNTGFYCKGELVKKRKSIALNYLKTQFLWDMLSLIYLYDKIIKITSVTDVIPNDSFLRFLGIFFVMRVKNLNKIIGRIEEFVFIEEKLYNTLLLIRLICFVIFVSHLFACIWHYIAFDRANHEITWLQFYEIGNAEWWIRYIYSFYYVVIVMNTVGFGDIVPQTNIERVYSIFFIYVACGIFAYTINSIGLILHDINKKNNNLKHTILLINSYMKQKNISVDLRIRIRKYIEYIWQEERVQNETETHDIINKLSRNLKEELLLNANGIILREFPLFYMSFSEDSLRKLVYHIHEVSLTPGDLVYSLNEMEQDQCLYIVRKGGIELFVDTPKSSQQPVTVLKTLKANEMFGEFSFFSEMPRETSARSSSFTSLFLIKKEAFLSIIKGNSDDYEIYCQLKDRINLYQGVEGLYQVCPACKQNDHSIINCSLLHLKLSKNRILQRYNYSSPQTRMFFKRNLKKNPNALKNFEKNENLAQKFSHDISSKDSDDDNSSDEVSSSNIKMDIKKEFNRLSSDLTNYPSNFYIPAEEKSPRFQDTKNRKSFLKSPSKLGTIDNISMGSNINININNNTNNNNNVSNSINNSNINNNSNNNKNNMEIRKPRSSMRRKPGTSVTAMQRQISKDSLSKNSIYSKKSSKSNKSIKFFPYDVSLTQNTNEDIKKLALPKGYRSPHRKSSNLTSIRAKTDDDFSEYMAFLQKEKSRNLNNVSDMSVKTKSHLSNNSKKSKSISKKSEEKKLIGPQEKPQTTMIEIDKATYEDIGKSYEFYFPYNNVEKVLEKIRIDSNKKGKRKIINQLNTKGETLLVGTIHSSNLNCEGIDLISQTQFKRRVGGNLDILKKKEFFKRKISVKKHSLDMSKLMKFLNKQKKDRGESLWKKIKKTGKEIVMKLIFSPWKCIKSKLSVEKKKGISFIVTTPKK